MVSVETTVDVPAEQYADHIPDDHDADTIEIGITAFGDSLYLKFPRFDRRGTNDFCMDASAIFEAMVDVKTNWQGHDIYVGACQRRMNVLRERQGDYVHGDPSAVVVRTFNNRDEDTVQLQVVNEFASTIAGFDEGDYWVGYKNGANVHGDEHLDWADIAWECFEDEWDGNKELLLDVGKWMAEEGMAVCARTRAFFPVPEWSTPTGSYVATISDVYQGKCPFCGADKDEHWECIKSPASTRRPNVYKCNACGETKRGITTG